MSQSNEGSVLNSILGKRLDAVCFILNYINFQFGDIVLAALAKPEILKGNDLQTEGQAGYRDALCGEIQQHVTATSETIEKLEISLSSGTRIVVPLNANDPPGPEMATLSGRGRFITAWLRPELAP